MSRLFLGLILIGCALALAVVAVTHEQDPIGSLLRYDDFSTVGLKAIALVLIAGVILTGYREKISRALQFLMIWGMIGVLLAVGYAYRFELRQVADRTLAEIFPGRFAIRGNTVEVVRANTGDFSVTTHINGARVPMLLDTGASAVVLTQEAARAAGLPTNFLTYSVKIDTANGHTQAAPVTLDRLAIGSITERSVQALIAQPGQLKTSLLGMSFLNRLESWEVRGTKLMLRGKPNG
jgi:aspartyl protease family protein